MFADQENVDPSVNSAAIAENILLGSKPFISAEIKCGCRIRLPLGEVDKGMAVVFEFKTFKYDISFGLKVGSSDALPQHRIPSHLHTIKGVYALEEQGSCTLCWDNRYSKFRSKKVLYRADIVSKAQLQTAYTANGREIMNYFVPKGLAERTKTKATANRDLVRRSSSVSQTICNIVMMKTCFSAF
jgi:hypothetical protein